MSNFVQIRYWRTLHAGHRRGKRQASATAMLRGMSHLCWPSRVWPWMWDWRLLHLGFDLLPTHRLHCLSLWFIMIKILPCTCMHGIIHCYIDFLKVDKETKIHNFQKCFEASCHSLRQGMHDRDWRHHWTTDCFAKFLATSFAHWPCFFASRGRREQHPWTT